MKLNAIVKEVIGNKIKVQVIKISRKKCNQPYIVNIGASTKFENCNIGSLTSDKIIQVTFDGVVALSMPPQISAQKIRLI